MTSLFIFFIAFIINFCLAVGLKKPMQHTLKENKWMKYFFIIPPFALICWVMAFIYFIFGWVGKVVRDYFKD